MSTTKSFGLLDFVFLGGVLKWPVTVSSHKSIRSSAEIRGDTSDFRSFNGMDSLDWKKWTNNTNTETIIERQTIGSIEYLHFFIFIFYISHYSIWEKYRNMRYRKLYLILAGYCVPISYHWCLPFYLSHILLLSGKD